MLQLGDELVYFSLLFLVVLLTTRSAAGASLLTALLYVFMVMFRCRRTWPAGFCGPQSSCRRRSDGGAPRGKSRCSGKHLGSDQRDQFGSAHTLAFVQASKNGATGVELDLSFTADGVPVLMHDETVDRTTNGSGSVSKLPYVHLRILDAAAHHRLKNRFGGEKVPTLQEAVEECMKHQLTIFFDVKGQPDKAASALHELYKKFPVLYNSSIVSSFEPKVIYKMRQIDPSVVTALTHRPWRLIRFGDGTPRSVSPWGQMWAGLLDVLLDWAHHYILWKLCGISATLVQKDFISLDYVQLWSVQGVELIGWTVNTEVEKEYYHNFLKISYITDSLLEDCDLHF